MNQVLMRWITSLGLVLGLSMLAAPGAQAAAYDEFFVALRDNNVRVARNFLERGMDPNVLDQGGEPALVRALRHEAFGVFDLLLGWRGIDLNRTNQVGENALMLAVFRGRRDLADKLIKAGADVNKTGWTPLHYAAATGNNDLVKLLLEHHAYIDAESPNLTTPIMMAARGGHILTVRLLLDEGADFQVKNDQGMTAIDFADRHGHKDIAEGLRARAKRLAERAIKPWK